VDKAIKGALENGLEEDGRKCSVKIKSIIEPCPILKQLESGLVQLQIRYSRSFDLKASPSNSRR